ncbi:MAG: substrate-binding domain-containing protein, partial [Halanaerobiaceae bacterium]
LRRRECHLAGIHLLDPERGEYNLPYLKKYLPDREIKLVNLAHRRQGLLVEAGNPLEISGLADLACGDISFLNRQRGSGTRILLDYLLEEEGIDPSEITGYGREEYTHLTLAGTIEAGGADAGVGIRAAADVFGLDFIPLAEERFDLAVPAEYREDRRIKELLAVLQTEAFKAEVEEMNGYRTLCTGEVVASGRDR